MDALGALEGPHRLVDYSTYPGQVPWSTMESNTLPPPLLQDAATKIFQNFWDSFENSVLYRTENTKRPSVDQEDSIISDFANRTYCSIPATHEFENPGAIYQNVHIGSHLPRIPETDSESRTDSNSCHYETLEVPRRNQCKKQPLLNQFTDFCAKKLAPRTKKDTETSAAPRGKRKTSKRFKRRKRSDKEPRLFGPEDEVTENEQVVPSGNPKCITRLLTQLQTEIAGLRYHGADLTKQMWLLYSTFEDFLEAQYPETAAGIKRYNVTDDAAYTKETARERTQQSHGDTLDDESMLDNQMNATSIWIEEVSRLHTNVAETRDWLRPEEECDEWSDDADRVHKLSESESETDTELDKSGDIVNANKHSDQANVVQTGSTDCMNISWYTKVKKIDKSSDRHYRTRTPERKFKNQQYQPGVRTIDESLDIVTPVRRPEELFGAWASPKQTKEVAKRQGYSDDGRHSPVTISSGYESDKDGAREREVDSILYGYLPEKQQQEVPAGATKTGSSPEYMCMQERQQPANKCNMHKTPYPGAANAFAQRRKDRRSMEELSATDDSEKTIVQEHHSPGSLSRCKSLDDVLRENGVVFVNKNNSLSPNSKKGKRKFSEVRRSMDFIIKDLDSPKKKHEHEPRRAVVFNDQSSVVCEPSMTDDQAVPLSDDDDDTASTVYENLPTALYAQVSPPKPEKVYKTPSHIGANPLWVSTPMDDCHRPRIMQSSGKKTMMDDIAKPQPDSSLKSRIRQKIGFLLDEKSVAFTPYKSAFRPYSKSSNVTVAEPQVDRAKIQEHSIAELRRGNGTPHNPYLCMSHSRSAIESQTAESVLLNDISIRSADLDETVTQDTLMSVLSPECSLRESGYGISNCGSPPSYNFPGFRNIKDSRIIHHDHLEQTGDSTFLGETSNQEVDPVYETIPSDIETICKGPSSEWRDTTSRSEHIYCRIGDVPTMLESQGAPEPPPARGRVDNVVQSSAINPQYAGTNKSSKLNPTMVSETSQPDYRILRPNEKVEPTDIVDTNKFHTYTVGDVLESFEHYAGHLENHAKNRNNIYGLMADHQVRRQFSCAMRGDGPEVSATNAFKAGGDKKDSKRSSKYSFSKVLAKYRKQSGDTVQGKERSSSREFKQPITDTKNISQPSENKENVCDFTPGFSQLPPFETAGPLYTGGGVRLDAVKKTLSFQDMSQMSSPQTTTSRPLQPQNGNRQNPRPMSAPRSGEFQPLQQHDSYTTYQRLSSQTQQCVQQPRPQSCSIDKLSVQHHRYASDCTPTVIDGLQSYNTTISDVTMPSDSSCSPCASDLIISPPSAFKGSPRSEDEDPVYENIRDMEIMRQNRKKAVEEGRSYRVTPLRRTKSALQIKWSGSNESREIFC